MMKVLRRVVFFLFLAIFLAGTPKIIFYALGYSYRGGTEKGLVQTGLVYLSTTPPGATVYVGGRRYREPTPAIIRDLLPGNYPVRLVLKDHEIWAKTIPVEAAKASVLGKILVQPKKPDWRIRVSGRFENLIPIPETNYILLKDSKKAGTIQIYDRRDEKTRPLFLENGGRDFQISEIYSVSGSERILIEADAQKTKKWAWIDLDKEDRPQTGWEEIFPFKPKNIVWSAKDPHYLFAFSDGYLGRFDTEKKSFVLFPEKIRGYGMDDRKLFLLTRENNFVSTDFLDKNRKPLLRDQKPLQGLAEQKGFFEIHHLADDSALFLGDKGQLIADQRSDPLVEKGVRGFHFDKKHRKVLIWTENAIGTISFAREKKEQNGGRPQKVEWLLTQAGSILKAFWAHDGSYIIFQDQSKVFLLELETFGAPALYELLETKGESPVFYTDDSGELFYLDKNTGNLMSLEVVPKWKVLEVPFSILKEKEREGKAAA